MIEKARDFLIEKLKPDFLMLFGSYATGHTHPESDLDIAFYKASHQLSAYDVFMLAQELASIIKVDVDLIDLNESSTVFRAQIFSTGRSIYVASQFVFDQFRMHAMSMYANLDIERKDILKSIIKRGTVYDRK